MGTPRVSGRPAGPVQPSVICLCVWEAALSPAARRCGGVRKTKPSHYFMDGSAGDADGAHGAFGGAESCPQNELGGAGWHWVAQAWGAPGGVVGSWPPARCRGVPGAVQPPAVPCSGQHTQRRGMPSTGPAEQEAMTRRKSGSGLRLGWGSGEGLPALIVRWCEAGGCGRVIFGTPPTPTSPGVGRCQTACSEWAQELVVVPIKVGKITWGLWGGWLMDVCNGLRPPWAGAKGSPRIAPNFSSRFPRLIP